ncbi:RNA-binding protein [Endozoicomonas sp. Mp262]|uniref:RNA recognition motif domain-containing protein n=1 Tax=Endozoicomonas sp. Mp262 TaxID=2919499 RepID=UPI0021D95511
MQKNKLFVGNLAFSSTEADLEQAFGQFGELHEVKVILDRETGRSRGFAFVTFANEDDAEAALSLDGNALNGRNIRVSIATERPRNNGPRREGGFNKGNRRF